MRRARSEENVESARAARWCEREERPRNESEEKGRREGKPSGLEVREALRGAGGA